MTLSNPLKRVSVSVVSISLAAALLSLMRGSALLRAQWSLLYMLMDDDETGWHSFFLVTVTPNEAQYITPGIHDICGEQQKLVGHAETACSTGLTHPAYPGPRSAEGVHLFPAWKVSMSDGR